MSKAYEVDFDLYTDVWHCKNQYHFLKRYKKAQKERWSWNRPRGYRCISSKKWKKYRFTYEYHTIDDLWNERKGETILSGRTGIEAWRTFSKYYLYDTDYKIINGQSVKVEEIKQ